MKYLYRITTPKQFKYHKLIINIMRYELKAKFGFTVFMICLLIWSCYMAAIKSNVFLAFSFLSFLILPAVIIDTYKELKQIKNGKGKIPD
jgi:hypothetical protein